MSQLTTNTTTIDELITMANNLPDAGSGGEDVSAETAEYTSLLTDLEAAVDALPDAGSGGGSGGSVETCNLRLIISSNLLFNGYAIYSIFEDGVINSHASWEQGIYDISDVTINNILCNSIVVIKGQHDEGVYFNFTTSGAEITDSDSYQTLIIFKITAQAGRTAVIELMT